MRFCVLATLVVSLSVLATACGPANVRLSVGPAGGPYKKDVFISESNACTREGELVNDGMATATTPVLSFAELSCLDVSSDLELRELAPGESLTFPLQFNEHGCDVQTIVDWFIDADEGSSRGTFNAILERLE